MEGMHSSATCYSLAESHNFVVELDSGSQMTAVDQLLVYLEQAKSPVARNMVDSRRLEGQENRENECLEELRLEDMDIGVLLTAA